MKAIFAVENFIYQCTPETKQELEDAVYDITHASIAALISIIGANRTKEFLSLQIGTIKKEYFKNTRNSNWEILEGLH